MTQLFIKTLEAALAGPSEKKILQERMVTHDIPLREKALGMTYMIEDEAGKKFKARDLLLHTNIESTTLVQTEMYATVMEGSEPAKVMRQILPIFRTRAGVLRVPKGETGTYAAKVAEGAEIPMRVQDYSSTDFTIEKYGVRPNITYEMVDRALYDVINMEVQKAGARVENALNQEALSVILENSGNYVDCGGSGNTPIQKVAAAIAENETDGFGGDTLILHPGMWGFIMSSFVPTYSVGGLGDDITRNGQMGRLLGARTFITGVTDNSSTYVWGWSTDNYIGGMVIDSRNAGAIAMERDIMVERYEDPIKQLVGASVTARFDANYLQANAICRILY